MAALNLLTERSFYFDARAIFTTRITTNNIYSLPVIYPFFSTDVRNGRVTNFYLYDIEVMMCVNKSTFLELGTKVFEHKDKIHFSISLLVTYYRKENNECDSMEKFVKFDQMKLLRIVIKELTYEPIVYDDFEPWFFLPVTKIIAFNNLYPIYDPTVIKYLDHS